MEALNQLSTAEQAAFIRNRIQSTTTPFGRALATLAAVRYENIDLVTHGVRTTGNVELAGSDIEVLRQLYAESHPTSGGELAPRLQSTTYLFDEIFQNPSIRALIVNP